MVVIKKRRETKTEKGKIMKRKSLLILVATLMGFIGQSKIFAAATVQDITWSNYAKSVTEIVTTDTNRAQ